MIKAISLFSGLGGDTLGMIQAGIDVVAYLEKEEYIRKTHELNFPNCVLIGNGDITKTVDEDFSYYKDKIDIIFAGFPCQGFSKAGKKDKNDERNFLFRHFIRATKLIQPKFIIGENVKGILSRTNEENIKFIDIITEEFSSINYDIKYKILDCSKFGIPQKRERLFIIGCKKNENINIEFPEELSDIKNLKYIIEDNIENSLLLRKHKDIGLENITVIKTTKTPIENNKPHNYLKSLIDQRDVEYLGKKYKSWFSFGKRISPKHCEILDISKPCKTIICSYSKQPRLFVGFEKNDDLYIRTLNISELKQIQDLPKDFIINGNYSQKITQIGNAVPPKIVFLIIKKLLSIN